MFNIHLNGKSRIIILRFCALLTILVGSLAVFFSVSLSLLGIGLGGGWSLGAFLEVLAHMGPLFLAGLLYALSGVAQWKSLPAVTGTTLSLQAAAWLASLAYCLTWIIKLQGKFGVGGTERHPGDPFDEEIVMMVFIPVAVLLLASVQFTYLWKTWRYQSKADTT